MINKNNMRLNKYQLELAITDFCNLNCSLCSQGTPWQKNKKTMSLEQIERISKFIEPFEFQAIKLSGGEPTLHPRFGEICENFKRWFPARRYKLATNGFQLEKFIKHLEIFDDIELSLYPGRNDEVFNRLVKLNLPNLTALGKEDYQELDDIFQESNLNKTNIYKRCPYSEIFKVVQDRIYPCCVIFGLSVIKDINLDAISVLLDENWRQNLAKINIEPYCKYCYVDVPAPVKALLYKTIVRAGRWGKQNIKPLRPIIKWLQQKLC